MELNYKCDACAKELYVNNVNSYCMVHKGIEIISNLILK